MRILVVEDDVQIAKFLKTSLEAEYFVVDVAEDGEQGSFLGRVNSYDLIILDNSLPKKEGLDVCREIREKNRTVKILILSVISQVPTKIELLNSGADDYMTKPFSLEELLARMKALLRRGEKIMAPVLQVDDLLMDTEKHIVKRGKREIHLTRKEFMLLELLMKNVNCVVSRGAIVEHVWDMHLDPFSNTLEAHVRNLRHKINSGYKKRLISTVSGRGYKI